MAPPAPFTPPSRRSEGASCFFPSSRSELLFLRRALDPDFYARLSRSSEPSTRISSPLISPPHTSLLCFLPLAVGLGSNREGNGFRTGPVPFELTNVFQTARPFSPFLSYFNLGTRMTFPLSDRYRFSGFPSLPFRPILGSLGVCSISSHVSSSGLVFIYLVSRRKG